MSTDRVTTVTEILDFTSTYLGLVNEFSKRDGRLYFYLPVLSKRDLKIGNNDKVGDKKIENFVTNHPVFTKYLMQEFVSQKCSTVNYSRSINLNSDGILFSAFNIINHLKQSKHLSNDAENLKQAINQFNQAKNA